MITAAPVPAQAKRELASTPASSPVRAEIVSTPAGLEAIEEAWRSIGRASGPPAPNATPPSFRAVLAAMGPGVEPYVVLWRDAGGPRGLLAARTQHRRLAGRLGYLRLPGPRLRCLDVLYGGLVTDGSAEMVRVMSDHLLGLLREERADVVVVHNLGLDHELSAPLREHARRMNAQEPHPHHTLELAGGLPSLSRKRRYQLGREDRLLREHFGQDTSYRLLTHEHEIAQGLALTAEIGRGTYKEHLGVQVDRSPLWENLLTAYARQGMLRLWTLTAQGKPIAYLLCCRWGDTLVVQAMGYRPEHGRLSPGKNLLWHAVRAAAAEGIRRVDYGPGDAMYKRVLGSSRHAETTLRLYGPSPRAALAWAIDRAALRLDALGREAAGLLRRTESIKKFWRLRLAKDRPPARPQENPA